MGLRHATLDKLEQRGRLTDRRLLELVVPKGSKIWKNY